MKLSRKVYSIVNLVLLGTLLTSTPVFAADYPTKPITLIHGFSSGGSTDVAARLIASYFGTKWGIRIDVVPKPGGNLVPSNLEVFTSKADGYTLLLDTNAASSFQAATMKNLPYEVKDRTFLARVFVLPSTYLCTVTRPWKTLKDVADFAKRDPGNLKWGATGAASSSTIGVLLFLNAVGIDKAGHRMVDYRGGSVEIIVALGSGEIDFGYMGIPPAKALIDAGKVRPLALVSPQRIKAIPTVPTVGEAGFPTLDSGAVWFGVSGPPGTPGEVVEKWNRGIKEALADAEFIPLAERSGLIPGYLPADEYKKMVLKQTEAVTEIFGGVGIR